MLSQLYEWLDTATFPVWQGLLAGVAVLLLLFIKDVLKIYRKYVVKGKK
jgi:hypothetical protein